MKENEAPKKIYIHVRANKELGTTWHGKKITNSDIEYTRTDAFIKKACDAYCKVCGHYAHDVPTYICRHNCDYYDDFKKYMNEQIQD